MCSLTKKKRKAKWEIRKCYFLQERTMKDNSDLNWEIRIVWIVYLYSYNKEMCDFNWYNVNRDIYGIVFERKVDIKKSFLIT
jgi:hypothetical protein